MKLIASIYRSKRHEGMYLYVEKKENLARVPESLLSQFGPMHLAMTLLLSEEKPLARVPVEKVMEQISECGFYLQLPPGKDIAMQDIALKNSKLSL